MNMQKVVEILKYYDKVHSYEDTIKSITYLENEIKSDTDIKLLKLCNALGWQGGTIHQVLDEIKKIKKDKEILFEILSKQVCEPDAGIARKDIIAKNCDGCKSYEICVTLAKMEDK